jgi:hypothetical protein
MPFGGGGAGGRIEAVTKPVGIAFCRDSPVTFTPKDSLWQTKHQNPEKGNSWLSWPEKKEQRAHPGQFSFLTQPKHLRLKHCFILNQRMGSWRCLLKE